MTGLCTTPFARLADKGVTGKLWRLIDALYQRCSARACIDGCQSKPLAVHCGVAQGCPLSPFLYAVFTDGLLASVHSECADSGLLAGDLPFVLQAYADDTNVLTMVSLLVISPSYSKPMPMTKSRPLPAPWAFNASSTQ
jgi:hypothetical protein